MRSECPDRFCRCNKMNVKSHTVDSILHNKVSITDGNKNIIIEKSDKRSSPIHMLSRLFPQHNVNDLETLLISCNKDPVKTIERLLDRKDRSQPPRELITNMPLVAREKVFSEPKRFMPTDVCEPIYTEDLSSIAKAYDIPVCKND